MSPPSSASAVAYGALTSAEVATLDQAAIAAGLSVAHLMETAGFQAARCTHDLAKRSEAREIVVIAGSGNNGGDGLVAARHLWCWGWEVGVQVVADPDRWKLSHLGSILSGLGIAVGVDPTGDGAVATLAQPANRVVLDALLGTGLTSPPRAPQAQVIEVMRGTPVISIDVPSGLNATTGEAFHPTVSATRTCTLGAMKTGLWNRDARRYSGEIWLADIGIPDIAWKAVGRSRPPAILGGELLPLPTDT